MTTIVYKRILGRYEIGEISTTEGYGAVIEFEKPIDGTLIVGTVTVQIKRGCGRTELLPSDGDYAPKLYTGGTLENIQGFTVSSGAVIPTPEDSEYLSRLALCVDSLLKRVGALEMALSSVEEKIERKITF